MGEPRTLDAVVTLSHPAALREAELRAAGAIFGVGTIVVLDHRDSGMDGDHAPGALGAADPAEVAREVRDTIETFRPDVIVTLNGSDGHRDHAVTRDATLVAVDAARHRPGATYLWCLARSSMVRWAEQMRAIAVAPRTSTSPTLGQPTTRSRP